MLDGLCPPNQLSFGLSLSLSAVSPPPLSGSAFLLLSSLSLPLGNSLQASSQPVSWPASRTVCQPPHPTPPKLPFLPCMVDAAMLLAAPETTNVSVDHNHVCHASQFCLMAFYRDVFSSGITNHEFMTVFLEKNSKTKKTVVNW